MGKINRSLTFNKKFLSKLVSDQTACVQICKKTYHLGLHPFHLTNLNSSIKEILNGKIAKYDKTFDGILLGYQNIKLLDNAGAINFDNCFIHTNIEADFYVFKPIVGQILNGVVNKKSKDHVGCLVHKTFNISLPKPENSEEWVGYSAQIGQEIQFEIIFTDLDGKLPYIKGKILSHPSEDSGISTSEEANCQENTTTNFNENDKEISLDLGKKKKRKRKSSSSSSEAEIKTKKSENYNFDNEKYEHEKHKHKAKKKKKIEIHLEGALNNKELVMSINDIKVKKTHKKRKKDKIDNEGDRNTNEKQYKHNFPVSLEGEISASNSHNDIIKTKKKKKHKYPQEVKLDNSSNNLNTEENLEKKHKKKEHKHKKESTDSEVPLKYEGKRHSEEVISDIRNEIRTHVKKKKR